MPALNESVVEQAALAWFEEINYAANTGAALGGVDAGTRTDQLDRALKRLNPHIEPIALSSLVATLVRPPFPTLVENNRWIHGLLTDGVPVEYRDAATGETRGGRARLLDFDDPAKNEFLVVQQLTIDAKSKKKIRPDLVLFVNGLPLVVIELKDPANPAVGLDKAIDQFARYRATAPALFVPNLLLVASDGLLTRVGSITSDRSRFMPWRPAGGGEPTLEALIRELLTPAALLDYLRSCVAFEEDARGNVVKKVAGYHQFRAVRRARGSVLTALRASFDPKDERAGRGGVVWHTQGSGKSLTMLMLAGALIHDPAMENPDGGGRHRPERPGRPALQHLRDGARAAAAGAPAGDQPRRPQAAARPGGRRGGVHDDPQVHRGRGAD